MNRAGTVSPAGAVNRAGTVSPTDAVNRAGTVSPTDAVNRADGVGRAGWVDRAGALTRPGDPRIRRQLAALAVVLLALWSYAAFLTTRDAADLLRVRALAETVGQPTDQLILDLQVERRVSAAAIAGDDRARAALAGARADTDHSAGVLRAAADGVDLRLVTAGAVRDRVDDLLGRLAGLPGLRAEADVGRAAAVAGYHGLIDAAFAVYGPEWGARESTLAAETRAVIGLARARELLAREDTLVTAALANGWLTADDRLRLTELVSTHRHVRAEATAGLSTADRNEHRALVAGPGFTALLALEDRLLRAGEDGPVPTSEQWRAAVDPALAGLHRLVTSAARGSVERATPGAALVVTRTGVVLGLGLVVVLGLLVGWVGTVRRLAAAAGGPASPWPGGPTGDPDRRGGALAGPDPSTAGFAGHLAGPVATAQSTRDTADRRSPEVAVRHGGTAVAEAIRPAPGAGEPALHELFVRLTQRNQVLLRDQLTLLDALERRERSAAEAAELFRLDHLATRIRRNVEKVVTLAGGTPARRWRRPVPLLDVARGAVAEVADYQRVLVAAHWPWTLAGPAVTDLVHLLAELIENALVCSPASSTVRVAAEAAAPGCAVLVTDDGPGLEPAALAELNRLLAAPPPGGPPAGQAGLYAAALLATRHGVRVSLRPGPRGGTTAVVWLPAGLVAPTGPDGGPAAAADAPARVGGLPAGVGGRPAGLAGAPAGAGGLPAGPDGGPDGGPEQPPVRSGGPGDSGGLPVRDRSPGSVRPGPGTIGSDTVEMPVPRAPRGR
ncbi:nitrate- and nitrite sensing domain-containing protein [Micromonospora echinaurantiaca]|uniref:sensor histidine kinase n=1 Tax=Micromonospora echinaurantiaca TaxID=47857 RepID=UPI003714DBD5